MKRLALKLGVDRAIFFTVLTRGWSASAGVVTVFLVSHFLSPVLQGYYYTFYSLIALQVFAELGLTFAIIQFTSHEMARLSWSTEGIISGDPRSKGRLQFLLFFAIKWLGILATVMVVLLTILGSLLYTSAEVSGAQKTSILVPWLILVICTALNIILAAIVAVLEGGGRVVDVAILRLWQSIFSVAVIWLVLTSGGDLFALAASGLITTLVSSIWLWLNFRNFLKDIYSFKSDLPGMDWRNEIWPFQWRIAISSLSGYFIFQLFNPILFVSHGPVAAGQMGMTMQIVGAMNGVAIAWITTKVPIYGKLIAKNQLISLDRLFLQGFLQSLVLLLIGSCGVMLVVKYLEYASSPYMSRVLAPHLFAILLLAGIANHVVSSEAAYLRAHKNEPFMLLSVLQGAVTAFLAIFLIPEFGVSGAAVSYAVPTIFIGLFWGTAIFFKSRKNSLTRTVE